MDYVYYMLVGLLIVGVVFVTSRTQRTQDQASLSGWIGLIIIGGLIGGLVFAGFLRNEKLAWFFGVALALIVPVMFFVAMGLSLSSAIRPEKDRVEIAINKKYDRAALICFALAIMFFGFPWVSVGLILAGVFFWFKSKKKGGVSGKTES